MRILYHHRTRAADAQGVHIAEMAAAFRQLGHTVEMATLVAPEGAPKAAPSVRKPLWQRMAQRVPFCYEALQLGYNAVGFAMLVRRIRQFRPDFIYERYSLFNFAGVAAARLFGIPLVLEVNSPLAMETREEGLLRLYGFGVWAERTICNSATCVVAVTGVLREMLIAEGAAAERVHVLPNGVAPEKFTPREPDAALRAQLALDGRRVIGFVGWFRAWHGLENLVQAFHDSGLHAEGVALLLVGDGPAMPDVRARVERLRLEDSVVLTGPLPHARIPQYVALFDCAVQPAANAYCCPMKVIEYLALGKPVIAPDQANLREIVDEGVEALVFEPGDVRSLASALRRFFNANGAAERLTAGALSAVERRGYLWTRNAERVIEWLGLGRR